ncbi:Gfo/Idh/MocA family protein [Microvirga puerhi]|uniref:Gfo/Idh/MocA family oxidoreductase n=1 Tax=Microvirga puerhi TaxID=2876078 RepID=A0ABS7VW90_9HYPH|nr:Gfo/Idh/MocA family oxidoreductase [Microvirga puerhi]MBZ6079390.1 Gfo/Idh/MocA family oxidoreductase [Microvirga puerhi]
MGIRTGLIGLGKMGISHLAIANSHPGIDVTAVCDSNPALLGILRKNTAFRCYQSPIEMIDAAGLDAVIISTPSRSHAELVRLSLKKNLHIFCEKPFCLDPSEGKALAAEAASRGRVGQVGYHFRFVGTFQKTREIVQSGCLGEIHHIRTEAHGPVVLRTRGATWRAQRSEGGGCLYDYASHAVDIVNFIYEAPYAVSGTAAQSIFSRDVDDEVYSTLHFRSGATGQLSANWSDDSHRKMSTRVTIWGSNGKAVADRQELQIYVRRPIRSYSEGWHVENITQLTKPVDYYLRGEEYTAQLDHFVRCINAHEECRSSFSTAADTDRVIQMLASDASDRSARIEAHQGEASSNTRSNFFRTLKSRVTSRG